MLFNVPYTNYGETVAYRSGGASMAARHGAVASLVRAVGPMGLRTPHTGGMNYAAEVAKIPTAAIPAEDANRIQRLVNRGVDVRLRLKMEAKFEPDVESFNVVGEIKRQREARGDRARRRPLRFLGSRHGRVGRRASAAS